MSASLRSVTSVDAGGPEPRVGAGGVPSHPAVEATKALLASQVLALLQDRAELTPEQLAAELGTTTARAMFAVRELERAGLVQVTS